MLPTFTAGPDFTPLSITVTLEINATEGDKCYDIQTTNDDIVEPIELFEVVLRNAEGVSIGTPSSQIIAIIDDGDSKYNKKYHCHKM